MIKEFSMVLILSSFTVLFVDGVQLNYDVMAAIEEGSKEKLLATKNKGYENCLYPVYQTPLYFAIKRKQERLALYLIERGAYSEEACKDVETREYFENPIQASPLTAATIAGSTPLVKALLAKGAHIGLYAFVNALRYNRTDIAELLFENGFNPNETLGFCEKTFFTGAAEEGCVDVIRLSLDKGVDVEQKDCEGNTALLLALRNWRNKDRNLLPDNRQKCALMLIDGGANVNVKNRLEYTPLLGAIYSNSTVIIRKLIEKGVNVNAKTSYGETPLSAAKNMELENIVQLLLENGARIVVTEELEGRGWDDPSTDHLINAIEAGEKETLLDLLSKGAKINKCSYRVKHTPLSFAISLRNEQIALFLIEKGADPNASCWKNDPLSNNPLATAASQGFMRLVKILLDKGAEINLPALLNAYEHDRKDIVQVFAQKGFHLNKTFYRCNITVLHFAVSDENIKAIKFMLENGVDTEQKDCKGFTALNRACRDLQTLPEDSVKCPLMLIDDGANVNTKDYQGITPLIYASTGNSIVVVKKLIEKGADVNATDDFGNSALSVAGKNGFENIIDFLLDNGAGIHKGTRLKKLPWSAPSTEDVIEAIMARDKEKLTLLISKWADISDCSAKYLFTPLSFAIELKQEEMSLILLEKGADANAACMLRFEHHTPLERATRLGLTTLVEALLDKGVKIDKNAALSALDHDRKDIVELFLQKGYDPNYKLDFCGRTLLFFAVAKGCVNITELLLEMGANIEHRDCRRHTALNWACREMEFNQNLFDKIEKCALVLIDGGAKVDKADQDWTSPLIFATSANSSIIVKKLIEKGADVNFRNNYGNTPWSIANTRGFYQIAKILQDHGAEIHNLG